METLKYCPQCGKELEAKDQEPYSFSDKKDITTGFDVKCRSCKWFGTIETQSGEDYKKLMEEIERTVKENAKKELKALESKFDAANKLSPQEEKAIRDKIPFKCAVCGKATKSRITLLVCDTKKGYRFCSDKHFNEWDG